MASATQHDRLGIAMAIFCLLVLTLLITVAAFDYSDGKVGDGYNPHHLIYLDKTPVRNAPYAK